MQYYERLNLLKDTGKASFTSRELGRVLRLKKPALKKALSRMRKKGVITRLFRDLYVLPDEASDKRVIASQLYSPYAYISFESALSAYGIINQVPYSVLMATYKTSKVKPFFQGELVLRRIKKQLFFGYKLEGRLLIAEPEKALLDTIYMKTKGLTMLAEEELNLRDLSKAKFLKMSQAFPEAVKKEARRLAKEMKG